MCARFVYEVNESDDNILFYLMKVLTITLVLVIT